MSDRRQDQSGPLAPPRSLRPRRPEADPDADPGAGTERPADDEPRKEDERGDRRDNRRRDRGGTPPRGAAPMPLRDPSDTAPMAPVAPGPSRRPVQSPARSQEAAETRPVDSRPASSRRARLRLTRIDPWSVMKTAFLLSIAFGIMCVVAVFIIWSVLGAANVFASVNEAVAGVIETDFAIEDFIGIDRVLPFTILLAVVDVVLITAVATLGAFLYNLAASLLGGLDVTLAEDER
ncbi:MAG: DUF3566 domain-containing protein [Actinomycetota bacterium]|nr:DUF3566 domain-containing protein [Actinomycetota bacterium]